VDAPVLTDFQAALDPANYVAVPGDWLIAVTDVVGSTAAISAGRYKDVNFAGAATIAGLVNAAPERELPFAFGGDGALVLVPPDLAETARTALKGVQRVVRNALALDTRAALIPVSAVRVQGLDVSVAYQTLAGQRKLAMLSGGGVDRAEAMCKSADGAPFAITSGDDDEDADLTGLSCRWQPLSARNGVMLTAIIRATEKSPLSPTYADIYAGIQTAARRNWCPVSESNLKFKWPPPNGAIERAIGRSWFKVYGESLLARLSSRTGRVIGGYNGRAYDRSVPAHSDYRKFADSLRMVIDCSTREADGIEQLLTFARRRGAIEFGLHRASSALMTCFVGNTDDGGHVHFIDGADGGYTLAAQQLKSRSAEAS
jgi:hypothetical protein